eukprot:m.239727 g.239727  ORF g.239727 m.239727 type:complete len:237 (-) comp16072_c0_seq4:1365-2075(-)
MVIQSEKYEDDFLKAVTQLSSKYHEGLYRDFIQIWGTDVVKGATMGGRLTKDTYASTSTCWTNTVTSVTQSIEAGFESEVKGGAKDGGKDVGGSTSFDTGTDTTNENNVTEIKTSYSWHTDGGNPALIEGDTMCIAGWRVSTRALPEIVSYQTQSVAGYARLALLQQNKSSDFAFSVMENIEKAVESYLENAVSEGTNVINTTVQAKECTASSSVMLPNAHVISLTLLFFLAYNNF